MQLYAYKKEGGVVFAPRAEKQRDYYCIECNGVVRVRGGDHRQPHYYHLSPPKECYLSQKSLSHIMTQQRIHSLFPGEDCQLEYRFPSIGRIADVVNHTRKTVFEVQCSFISSKELLARNRDYGKEGYKVVWILHEKTYNHRRLTAAENSLKEHSHYFTNIDQWGKGVIYDQLSYSDQGFRKGSFGYFTVDISSPKQFCEERFIQNGGHPLPLKEMKSRMNKRGGYFSGDALDLYFKSENGTDKNSPFYKLSEMENQHRSIEIQKKLEGKESVFIRGKKAFSRGYKIVLHMLLEESCR